MNDLRPDPDPLLHLLKEQEIRAQRGKLKIFFGASAGVGKTFAMLSAARQLSNQGVDVDVSTLALDDEKTYQLLARGDTLGVFQLDGGAMRSLLRQMGPSGFDDITAVLALYRPGPMGANAHIAYAERKNGRQEIIPIHPELKEALDPLIGDTFHLIVYQEQIMLFSQKLAG